MALKEFTAFDAFMMTKALELAKKGRYTARPNPVVGCVIVKNHQIIGQGYHRKAGLPHAEVEALTNCHYLGNDPEGANVYVTLEPCSHHGRTPPCVNALIKAKVKRVIIASKDSNPNVNGIDLLKKAGIEVITGCLTDKADALNIGFLSTMVKNKPYVRLKLAASLDGRTAMASGESKWITSALSRSDVQRLRARSGAIITGIGTILSDNPLLTVRDDSLVEADLFEQPLRVILDRHLKINLDANVLKPQGKVLIVTEVTQSDKLFELQNLGVLVKKLAFDSGDFLDQVLVLLKKEFAISDVLVESGATLAGSFLKANLIDEFWYYMAPCIMGVTARALFNCQFEKMAEKYQFKLQSVKQFGEDVRMIYLNQPKGEQSCG